MKRELNDQLKELVSPGVYEIVDKSTDIYVLLGKIQETMNRIEAAGEYVNKNLDPKNWRLILEARGSTFLRLDSDDVLAPQIIETIKQLINLLEAIHYSERKQTIIDFNNSLKENNDGKSTEE